MNRYAFFSIPISSVCVVAIFLPENPLISLSFFHNQNGLIWLTSSLTAANIIILTSLFCKGKLNCKIILLNLIQLAVFCQLQIQICNFSQQDHSSSVPLKDHYEFVAFHVLSGFDLADVMMENTIVFQKSGFQNALAAIAGFSMSFMAGILCIGIFFKGIRYVSKIERIKVIKNRICPGVLITSLLMIFIAGWINQDIGRLHLRISDEILRVLDFGDIFQIFGWHNTETDSRISGILFRLGVLIGLVSVGYRYLYLPALEEAVMDRIEELKTIIASYHYPPRKRMDAILELQSYGEIAELAIPELIRMLENHHKELRRAAAGALKEISPKWAARDIAQKALPGFLDKLRRADTLTRIAVAEAIGEFGQYARKAVPVLTDVCVSENEDRNVRDAASHSLMEIGQAAVPDLVRVMDSTGKDKKAREEAARILARIGTEHPNVVVPPSVRLLKSNDEYTRDLAGDVLRDIGPDAVSTLTEMLRRGILPNLVITAFRKIRPVAIMPRLLELLRSEELLRKSIVHVLKKIAPSQNTIREDESLAEAVGNFIKALRHEEGLRRASAARALGEIGHPARKAIPALAKALCDDSGEVRAAAKEALNKIVLPPFSISDLIKKLIQGEGTDRCNASRELGEIGEGAEKAIPFLVMLLGDADQTLRYEAARALRRIDPQWRRHECLDDLIPFFINVMGGVNVEVPLQCPS
ncbi:HEAT repeat domain-containing protein [Desulfococcaceae bacterium HSG8]|nr:HEAT repeat domain-containing protein [Desulfococcaceae bacterium HSG8]